MKNEHHRLRQPSTDHSSAGQSTVGAEDDHIVVEIPRTRTTMNVYFCGWVFLITSQIKSTSRRVVFYGPTNNLQYDRTERNLLTIVSIAGTETIITEGKQYNYYYTTYLYCWVNVNTHTQLLYVCGVQRQ